MKGNPAITLTALISLFYVALCMVVMNFISPTVIITALFLFIITHYIIMQVFIIKKIPATFSPEARIKTLNGFIRRNTVKLNIPFNRAVRRRALTLLARAHADKGDYAAVYRTYAELAPFLPAKFMTATQASRHDAEFYAVVIEAFIHTNRLKAAEDKLNEMLGKVFTDESGEYLSKYVHAYFLVHAGDFSAARKLIVAVRLYLNEKHKNIYDGVTYLEVLMKKHEKKYEEAFADFSCIVESSRDYGIVRKAKKELEYWTTRF
jgi:tetratricopeptide (TPR) repeat protein